MQKSYLKRIIKEKKKLNKKIDKLMTFIMCDPEFGKLSDEYQSLLSTSGAGNWYADQRPWPRHQNSDYNDPGGFP